MNGFFLSLSKKLLSFSTQYSATAILTESSFQGVSNQAGKLQKFQGVGGEGGV